MEKFNYKLQKYLTVYKTPIAPDQLDPCLFYFPETGEPPKLLPGVYAQIANDLQGLASENPARIKKCVIIGDAVKPGKEGANGDIEVLVILNKDIMDLDIEGVVAEEILKVANALSKRQAVGSTRKIKYSIRVRDLDLSEHEGVYNVSTNEWIKIPSGVK